MFAHRPKPQFWHVFDRREHGESDFSLKVRIRDKDATEHFWLVDVERRNVRTFGTIDNDPETVNNVKAGDRVEIPEADITDWTYMRDGKIVGNFTIRPLLKSMPPEQAEKVRKALADQ